MLCWEITQKSSVVPQNGFLTCRIKNNVMTNFGETVTVKGFSYLHVTLNVQRFKIHFSNFVYNYWETSPHKFTLLVSSYAYYVANFALTNKWSAQDNTQQGRYTSKPMSITCTLSARYIHITSPLQTLWLRSHT